MVDQINLKNLSAEQTSLLHAFFKTQTASVWEKNKTYKLVYPDQSNYEFQLTNEVYRRERKSGFGVRYDVISNKPYIAKGGCGTIHMLKGTLVLEENNYQFKKEGKDQRKRICKKQFHESWRFPVEKGFNEYELVKAAGHLGVKKPAIAPAANNKPAMSYMTQEYIPGTSLKELIEDDYSGKKILTSEQRYEITKGLLSALKEQVTDKKIYHRDLKPSNIQVDLSQKPIKVTILDYGLGVFVSKPDNKIVGTERFYSPDIIKNPAAIDYKSDVYSLARTLALLWRVKRERVYNLDFAFTTNSERWKEALSKWTAKDLLVGLFSGINDLDPALKPNIRKTLEGMLANDPKERMSIDEAIASFSSFDFKKRTIFNSKNSLFSKEIKNFPISWLREGEREKIEKCIEQLEKEINSCWPYPNKERKKHKVHGLKWLLILSKNQTLNIQSAVERIESKYSDFRAGGLSTRVADLIDELMVGPSLEDKNNSL